MDKLNKVIDILSLSTSGVVIRFILLIGLGIFVWYLKSAARELMIKRARKEEEDAKIKAELEQTKKTVKLNEEIKTDGNKADVFLGD